MLEQPPLEECEGNVQMCLRNRKLIADIDAVTLARFCWSLWDMATNGMRGCEISISTSQHPSQEQTEDAIGYCEITLTGEGPVRGILHNPNAEFLHRGNRVDLFVNPLQAEFAYLNLEKLEGTATGQEATLFGRLIVRVVK